MLNRLGIRIERDCRENEDVISPDYPLIAFSYYRSGFIRLSGKKDSEKNIWDKT